MRRKTIGYSAIFLAILLAGIQFIQPDRTNPPINPSATFKAIAGPGSEIGAIVDRACRDCHTNDTQWPLYSRIAPISWLVANDVKQGRAHLNFSEWGYLSPEMANEKLKQACREVTEGDMPLWQYRVMHPEARLSKEDIEGLCKAAP
jgi:hypothetical protein